MKPREQVAEIRRRGVEALELLGWKFKADGPDNCKTLCDAHPDKHASLSINRHTGAALCRSCGWKGDAIAVVRKRYGDTFPKAIERMALVLASPIDADKHGRQNNEAHRDKTHVYKGGDPPHPRRLVARYVYDDASGVVVGFVDRIEEAGRKRFNQWRKAGEGWEARAMRPPRPLYRLCELHERPDAAVLVCEGEKAANAAAALLPDYEVTTSAGGSNGARLSDWTTLSGRDVTIWPDADAPGLKYASTVAELACMACARSVRIVALPPSLPQGWDLGDLPGNYPVLTIEEVSAMLEAAPLYVSENSMPHDEGRHAREEHERSNATPESEPRTADIEDATLNDAPILPEGYSVETDESGIQWLVGSTKTSSFRICRHIEVVATVSDANGNGHGRLVRFTSIHGRARELMLADVDLHADRAPAVQKLIDAGVGPVGQNAVRRLRDYLVACRPAKIGRLVYKAGWATPCTYLLPHHGAVTQDEAQLFVFNGEDEATAELFGSAGTVNEWRNNVAALCVGNPLLTCSVSAAFAAPLLDAIGDSQGATLHIVGPSTTGKSTVLLAAGSVWGGNGRSGFTRSWSATGNAIEAIAERHNDCLLVLDEVGEIPEARDLGRIAYMLQNGSGKGRMKSDASSRRTKRWRVLTLSSGEIGLREIVEPAGHRIVAGQEVRFLEIPVPSCGAIEELHGRNDSASFVNELRLAATTKTYGTAGPAFVRQLVLLRAQVGDDEIRRRHAEIRAAMLGGVTSPMVGRAAKVFAAVALAGELATEFDLTEWDAGAATAAAGTCFDAWQAARGTHDDTEVARALEDLRACCIARRDDRFERFPGDTDDDARPDRPVVDPLGYYQPGEDGEHPAGWWFYSAAFEKLVTRRLRDRVLNELEYHGWLAREDSKQGKTRRQYQRHVGKLRPRFYVLRLPFGSDVTEAGTCDLGFASGADGATGATDSNSRESKGNSAHHRGPYAAPLAEGGARSNGRPVPRSPQQDQEVSSHGTGGTGGIGADDENSETSLPVADEVVGDWVLL